MPRRLLTPATIVLLCGFAILFIGGGARFAVGLTLKPIVEEFGWPRSALGLAVAMFQFVSALAMFWAGRLADARSPRLVLVLGLALGGIGIGTMGLITQPWHAVVLYGVLYGLGNGAASLIPVGVMVTRAFPVRTGMVNAVVTSGMSVGQLVVIAGLAALLATLTWRSMFFGLGLAHLALAAVVMIALPKIDAGAARAGQPADGLGVAEALRTPRMWLLLAIYAICGFDDFFVATHVVAFAQDRGVDALLAGNLLAMMGLTGLIGVVAAGIVSDRFGPVLPTALSFLARVLVFGLVLVDQSPLSVAIFALVFGATFMVTAPLAVIFATRLFGARHLGALTGLVTMVHQIAGGLGAWLGAAIFDASGGYGPAFAIMFALSALALALCLPLARASNANGRPKAAVL
ncbi:MAG: MFS transporter [Methylobacteriaceae bacterium]|nr:MFS transporter [Methylobacteriaceae bacterium]